MLRSLLSRLDIKFSIWYQSVYPGCGKYSDCIYKSSLRHAPWESWKLSFPAFSDLGNMLCIVSRKLCIHYVNLPEQQIHANIVSQEHWGPERLTNGARILGRQSALCALFDYPICHSSLSRDYLRIIEAYWILWTQSGRIEWYHLYSPGSLGEMC